MSTTVDTATEIKSSRSRFTPAHRSHTLAHEGTRRGSVQQARRLTCRHVYKHQEAETEGGEQA